MRDALIYLVADDDRDTESEMNGIDNGRLSPGIIDNLAAH